MDYIGLFKQALKDQRLDIECITTGAAELAGVVESLPNGSFVSEWRYGLGLIIYEYRLHERNIGLQLVELLRRGIRGGHPHLTAVYSKGELERIIVSPRVSLPGSQDNMQSPC